MAEHQQRKDRQRQGYAHRQRAHHALAIALIAEEKEQPGKQAADHSQQQENDDELEHGQGARLR